jgi:hypothetical protein
MWLAPFVNRFFENPVEKFNDKLNTIFITFDRPLTIAAISFWNYSKHPERGVRELAIWLDERLIFKVPPSLNLRVTSEFRKINRPIKLERT